MKNKYQTVLSKLGIAVVVVSPTLWSARGEAAVTFNFDTIISGGTPSGTSPWATLLIENAGSNTVNMTLSHVADAGSGQFLSQLLLNLNVVPGNLAIIESSPKIVGFAFGNNAFNAPGNNRFDLEVSFGTANRNGGIERLKPGESVSWQLTGTGLTEDSFLATTKDGWYNMIHVQGIPGKGKDSSSKITGDYYYCEPPTEQPVPEPASLVALGLGAAALLRRRRAKKA